MFEAVGGNDYILKKYFDCNMESRIWIWWMKKQAWGLRKRTNVCRPHTAYCWLILWTNVSLHVACLDKVLDIVSTTQVKADYYHYHCHRHLGYGILNIFLCKHPMEYHYPCLTNEETAAQRGLLPSIAQLACGRARIQSLWSSCVEKTMSRQSWEDNPMVPSPKTPRNY